MDRKLGKLAAVSMLFLSNAAIADDPSKVTVFGLGNKTCGAYISDIESNDAYAEANYNTYFTGFLSGSAVFTSVAYDTDIEAASKWVQNYCRENPLDKVVSALMRLHFELKTRKGGK